MRAEPMTLGTALRDLKSAIVEMPRPMRQLALAMLFQWYAMFCYWQFIVLAIGRSPNTKSLGLEQAGVAVNERGAIIVDQYSRTNVASIFALGDVTGNASFGVLSIAVLLVAALVFLLLQKDPTRE